MTVKTAPADAFSHIRLYGEEKYKLDNMELKAVNFPARVDEDHITSTWSDRILWDKARAVITTSSMYGDAFYAGVSDVELLKWAQIIADEINFNHQVTGVRVVRYTNPSSGYPILRADLASGGSGRCRNTRQRSEWWSPFNGDEETEPK